MIKKFKYFILLLFFVPFVVRAYENTNTYYNYIVDNFTFMDSNFPLGSNTYKQQFDYWINLAQQNNLYLYIGIKGTGTPSQIQIRVFNSYPLIECESYYYSSSTSSRLYYYTCTTNNSNKGNNYTLSSMTQNDLDKINSCLSDYNNCIWGSSLGSISSGIRPSDYSTINSNTNFNNENYSYLWKNVNVEFFPIYANFRLVRTRKDQSLYDDNKYYFKNVKINNITINYDMSYPTYYDLYYGDNPINPEPEPDEPTSTTRTSWVYWFGDSDDDLGFLNNIYTLLFLYCITMILFRVYSIVKNTKW